MKEVVFNAQFSQNPDALVPSSTVYSVTVTVGEGERYSASRTVELAGDINAIEKEITLEAIGAYFDASAPQG